MKLKVLLFSLLALLASLARTDAAVVYANVAKDGVAYANQPLYGAGTVAQQLIDGSKSPQIHGDVNLTPGFAYTIDLGKDYSINDLKIYPRQDGCCAERLTKFRVSLHSDDGFGAMGPEVWGADQFMDGSNPGSGAGRVFSVTPPSVQTARWVEIRSLEDPVPNYALQISEVEVFAAVQPTEVNRAVGAIATANQGLYPGTVPANLVDGNRGNYAHGNQNLTPGFAYDINLGVEVTMTKVDVFGRLDCCSTRLTNYRLSVHSDNAGQIGPKVWSADIRTDGSDPGVAVRDTFTADMDPTSTTFKGQWIRIESLEDPVSSFALQVAEVEVFGTIPEAVTLIVTSEPQDAGVGVGGAATFALGLNAINADPALLTYQWEKNGVPITGATNASYTTPVVLSGDSGSRFQVKVSYPGVTTVVSREATLRVNYALGAVASVNGPLWPPGAFNIQQIVDGSRVNFLHGDAVLPVGYSYEMRLGGAVNFDAIDIYPRNNCCPERLRNIRVSIHNDDNGSIGAETWSADLFTAEGTNAGATPVHVIASMDTDGGTFAGRWIKITDLSDPVPSYALQLAEVEAFGTLVDPTPVLTITQVSSNAVAAPGRFARLSVDATIFNGLATNITFQWRKNGTPITGATNRIYTTDLLYDADLTANYSVAVAYPGVTPIVTGNIPVVFDYNYARFGSAASNQKLWVGVPDWNISQIIDGDLANFVHGDTGLLPGYAYTINMGNEVTLTNITLHPRQDACCPQRMKNFRVSVHSDNAGQIGDQVWYVDLFTEGDNAGMTPVTLTADMDPVGTFKGQWIKITSLDEFVPDYVLQLGEVEAVGSIAVPPQLSWTASGGLTLTWSSGTLESNTDLNAPNAWATVNGAASPYPVLQTGAARYYRLRQ